MIFLLGTCRDFLATQRGIQCERKFGVEERCANAKFACCPRQQFLLQPGLVIGDGVLRSFNCRFQLSLIIGRQGAHVRDYHRVNDRCEPGILGDRSFGVNLGYSLGLYGCSRLLEKTRNLIQPCGCALKAALKRRIIARDQAVDRTARNIDVVHGVPCPLLQLIQRPEIRLELVHKNVGVDLVGARQAVCVHRLKRVGVFEQQHARTRTRGGIDLV